MMSRSKSFCARNKVTCSERAGFSLVEVLVTIGVISVLLGLTLPAVQMARDSAARTRCSSNLREVGLALHNYHSVHEILPPQRSGPVKGGGLGNDPNRLLAWWTLILPYIDQSALWTVSEQACLADSNPLHDPPHIGYSTVVRAYTCPADFRSNTPQLDLRYGKLTGLTGYIGVSGYPAVGPGVFGRSPGVTLTEITDGTSSTLMVGERPPPDSLQAGQWYSNVIDTSRDPEHGPDGHMAVSEPHHPLDNTCRFAGRHYGPGRLSNPCDRYHFWSLHKGGSNFLFADGAIRFLPYSARDILPLLATRSGGEVAEMP